MVNWKELYLILTVLMLLGWCIYCLCSHQGTDRITILFAKIKCLIGNIWVEFKRNMAEYLNVVYKLALFALAKSVVGGPDIWKVYWMISFATFAISCYCLKLCVERKRAQLTPTSKSVTPTNYEKVWFLTATNALEFLFPLSYLRLAFAYFMELNLKNHPSENFWKTFAHGTKIGIDVLAFMLLVISIIEICNTAQVEDQFVADPPEVVQQGDTKNHLVADVALQMGSGKQSVEDAGGGVLIHVDDVEGRSFTDANQSEVSIQMDAENHSVADANPPGWQYRLMMWKIDERWHYEWMLRITLSQMQIHYD